MKTMTEKKMIELSSKFKQAYTAQRTMMAFDIQLITLKRLEEQNELLKQIIDKP